MTELKPCPFCGRSFLEVGHVFNPDAFWDGGLLGEDYYRISCGYCNLVMKWDTEREAIEAWNRRANDDRP